MTSIRWNRKVIEFTAWLLAALILLVMAGCSPYVETGTTVPTATPSPAATVINIPAWNIETPAPYWQLAAQEIKRLIINPANYSGRINRKGE